jgi:hypothetical protein
MKYNLDGHRFRDNGDVGGYNATSDKTRHKILSIGKRNIFPRYHKYLIWDEEY